MPSGTIAKLNEKGFGFIKQQTDGKDVFFHATGLVDRSGFDELQIGDPVTFDLDNSDRDGRTRAVRVQRT